MKHSFTFILLIVIVQLYHTYGQVQVGQSFSFPDFSSTNIEDYISMQNRAVPDSGTLFLCPNTSQSQGQAWYKIPIQILGLNTTFVFQLSDGTGEGFAFVIQTGGSSATANGLAGGLGYADKDPLGLGGIPSSIAFEFDTYRNLEMNDTNDNHVSVHTRASDPNSAYEGYSIQMEPSVPTMIESTHTVNIAYIPQPPDFTTGQLTMTMTGISGTVLDFNFKISDYLELGYGNSAFIGFTASSGNATQAQNTRILSWTYQFLGQTSAEYTTASTLASVVAGTPQIVYVYAKDQFNNDMLVGGAAFAAVLTSENVTFNYTDYGNGTYSFAFVCTKAVSNTNLQITLNGEPISTQVQFTVTPGPVFAGNCIAYESSNSGLTGGTAGDTLNFYVQVLDAYQNKITTQPKSTVVTAKLVSPTGNTVTGTGSWNTKQQAYLVSYSVDQAVTWNMYVTLNGNNISNPTYNITIVPNSVDGSTCYAFGDGLLGGIVGQDLSFFVQLTDQYNNTITNNDGDAIVEVEINGPKPITPRTSYVSNGIFQVTYRIVQSGNYDMDVYVDTNSILDSPFSLKAVPEDVVYPPNCVASGQMLRNSTAGVATTFRVQIADYFGNNITKNLNLQWDVSVLTASNRYSGNVAYVNNGVYLVTYNATVSDTYSVFVTINGSNIRSSPFLTVISPAATYGPQCYAEGDGLSAAWTDESSSFSIVARDAFGNLRLKGGDAFNITIKDNIDAAESKETTIVDHKNGTYAVTYTLKESGEYFLHISLNGLQIQGSPFGIQCKWSGLPTWAVLTIGSVAVVLVTGAFVGFWIYRRKHHKRKEYKRIDDPTAS